VLLDEKATRRAVIGEIRDAAKTLKSGDIFLYTFSGHGSQVTDFNGDEKDKLDETWCLFDGMLIDDEAYELWTKFREGVRVIALLDCCHSGSAIKASPVLAGFYPDGGFKFAPAARVRRLPPSIAKKTLLDHEGFYRDISSKVTVPDGTGGSLEDILLRPQRPGLRCSVRLISGCQDNQESLDGDDNGRFTAELLTTWNNGRFSGNYYEFHEAIVDGIARDGPGAQRPNHMVIGVRNAAYDSQRPFAI
jgi:hypothetical protein